MIFTPHNIFPIALFALLPLNGDRRFSANALVESCQARVLSLHIYI
ncbi:hypothetical protein IQ238_05015 [Pleurocapsales cyanobacterium LEGE 06147]|nr:hypothetical protein [Pleurocapsales cyanobacterium LEGE 06147]